MYRSCLLVFFALTFSACAQTALEPTHTAGYEQVRFQRGERPVAIDLWYPAGTAAEKPHRYGISVGSIARSAPKAGVDHPLVVLSHGTYGSANNYSWIGEALARSGFVVAGVSHFGESYDYGPQTVNPQVVARLDRRVGDVSSTVDYMLADKAWSDVIDSERVFFIGHSSGGATGALSAGATFDLGAMVAHCQTEKGARDASCGYAKGIPLDGELPIYGSLTDARLKAFVLLDPAVGPAMRAPSLQTITTPTLIFGAKNNDALPFDVHFKKYADNIPGAQLEVRGGNEGHFIFLDVCDQDIDALGVKLCEDRDGANRQAAHEEMVPIIVDFLSAQ